MRDDPLPSWNDGANKQAILDFEPRIAPATLQVEAIVAELAMDHHNVVAVQISGQLWAQPVRADAAHRGRSGDRHGGDTRSRQIGARLMDPRLLGYYNQELQHLREMGAEFARQFPKIGARLAIEGIEVADPYVERLLEGAAFLAARVQLKLDAEFPRFTQRLLEIVYPGYLAPTPAMVVARFEPELTESNLAKGVTIPRGSSMRAQQGKGDVTACEFRTAHALELWPIELPSAQYFAFAPDLPLAAVMAAEGLTFTGLADLAKVERCDLICVPGGSLIVSSWSYWNVT